jgi:hypothetical protein
MRLAWRAAMVACVLALSNVAAFAQTQVYSSGNNNPTLDDPIYGPGESTAQPKWEACAFTPTQSGTLDHVEVGVLLLHGFNGIVLSVVEGDAKGPTMGPMHVLDTMMFALSAGGPSMTKVASVNHPVISAGKTYWLVMSPVGLDTFVYWSMADLKSNNQCLVSADGGQTWFYPHNPQDLFTVYIQ